MNTKQFQHADSLQKRIFSLNAIRALLKEAPRKIALKIDINFCNHFSNNRIPISTLPDLSDLDFEKDVLYIIQCIDKRIEELQAEFTKL